jgi:hypothetical protein
MELHKDVISKIICDQVLNDKIPDHVKQKIAGCMSSWGETLDVIIYLALKQPDTLVLRPNDFVLYKLQKDWRTKELGELDLLLDKGLAYVVNGETVYLGKITGSGGYGEFNHHDSTFKLQSYGVTDDLDIKTQDNTVSYIDIMSIHTVKSTKLIGIMNTILKR